VRSCAHGSVGSIPAPHRVAVVQGLGDPVLVREPVRGAVQPDRRSAGPYDLSA